MRVGLALEDGAVDRAEFAGPASYRDRLAVRLAHSPARTLVLIRRIPMSEVVAAPSTLRSGQGVFHG